jgi:hypothetical protein
MSPTETVQDFLRQMLKWEMDFHAKKRSEAYKGDPEYRRSADEAARSTLTSIFSEHLSTKALAVLGSARLDTLGTGQPPEYEQTVLTDTAEASGVATHVEAVRMKGLKQRYRYSVIEEQGTPKIDGVSIWRASSGKWERRNAI